MFLWVPEVLLNLLKFFEVSWNLMLMIRLQMRFAEILLKFQKFCISSKFPDFFLKYLGLLLSVLNAYVVSQTSLRFSTVPRSYIYMFMKAPWSSPKFTEVFQNRLMFPERPMFLKAPLGLQSFSVVSWSILKFPEVFWRFLKFPAVQLNSANFLEFPGNFRKLYGCSGNF